MSAFPDIGGSLARANEAVTEALYNGTALVCFADEDGVWIEYGEPMAGDSERIGPFFDLHAALVELVEVLGGES